MEKEYKLLPNTFFWMFLGLLATAGISIYTYLSGLWVDIIVQGSFNILLIVELGVVILFSLFFRKLPATIVGIMYFIYAAVNGVTFATIFYAYELNSIVFLFIAAAVMFALFGLIGYKTEKDLSSYGKMFTIVLIVGFLLSIFNIFIGNSVLDIVLDWVMLFTFFGITVYDMNKIRAYESVVEEPGKEKLHIYCAMDLYLDFINIFLRLLELFGRRKD